MDKEQIIAKLCDCGIVAVVRAENADKAKKITEACLKGGVAGIEMTFTVPHADQVIAEVADEFKGSDIILGAGTVLDAPTARTAILAGAQFIVSPYLNVETVKLCNKYRVPCMPGAMTIKEVVEAMEAGADIIKIFPADLYGPTIIKDIRGPLPYAKLMPTGGVDVDNVAEWIKAGVVCVGAGSSLTAGAKTGDWDAITNTGKLFVERIKEARAKLGK